MVHTQSTTGARAVRPVLFAAWVLLAATGTAAASVDDPPALSFEQARERLEQVCARYSAAFPRPEA